MEQVGLIRQEVTRIGRRMDRMDRRVSRLDRRVRVIGSQVGWTAGVAGRTDGMMEAAVHAAGLRVPPPAPDPVFEEDEVSEYDQDEGGPSCVDPMAENRSAGSGSSTDAVPEFGAF
mgnify:CR=1 FL=1